MGQARDLDRVGGTCDFAVTPASARSDRFDCSRACNGDRPRVKRGGNGRSAAVCGVVNVRPGLNVGVAACAGCPVVNDQDTLLGRLFPTRSVNPPGPPFRVAV